MQERWLPIFDGRYDVSDHGHIRSWVSPGTGVRLLAPRKLTVRVSDKTGYAQIGLTVSPRGRQTTFLVHRLVCMAFHGEQPPGQETRHLNGVRSDNRAENLAWGTRSQNAMDRFRHGTGLAGERSPFSTLRERDVALILGSTATSSSLAKELGVDRCTVADVRHGRTWRHIERTQ